jgi:predicted dinucleotide-binding enzyme
MNTNDGTDRPVIGIYGAGKSGVAIARRALESGYRVKIATSAPASETAMIASIVTPGAIAVDTADVAAGSDIVVIAVPLRKFRELSLDQLDGRVVIDVMNYWPPIDGTLPEFDGTDTPSSVIVQGALPAGTRLVKTFNHLGYHQMEDLARPTGEPGRIGLGVASDDTDAATTVMEFIDAVGFDPVFIGSLDHSAVLQPETPLFGSAFTAADITNHLDLANR